MRRKDYTQMREVLSYSVTPMLLGNNKRSRRLARRLFWRFGLRSSVFDAKSSRELDFMISSSFSPLPETSDDEFIILGLERFASERDDTTCLLVPCSHKFVELIKRNKNKLEARFIIRLPLEIEQSFRIGAKMPYAKKGIS